MKNIRIVVGLALAAALVLAGYLTLRGFEFLGAPAAEVRSVPAGHQELAWIAPATSDEAWERLVAAVRYLVDDWPGLFPDSPPLRANFDQAFLDLTVSIPEVGLYFQGAEHQVLWLRWYKLASGIGMEAWLDKLAARGRPPLAIAGGDTSDRAVRLAGMLRGRLAGWHAAAPLFLITTASADRFSTRPGGSDEDLTREDSPKLIEVYRDRTFRFAFTNTRIAEAIMDFLGAHPDAWLPVRSDPRYVAGMVGNGTPWGCLARLAAGNYFQGQALYVFAWADDGYSRDLADRFGRVFADKFAAASQSDQIDYGIGDYSLPNPPEARAAQQFLANTTSFRLRHTMLALPTSSQRARRFLRTLCGIAPLDTRNLVVVSGDAINFNDVYRDHNLAWNVLDIPVPLVFFCHRNPIAERVGFRQIIAHENRVAATGTQDLLLYVDIFEAVIQAAFQQGKLVADADLLRDRLKQTRWYQGKAFNAGFTKVPPGAFALFTAAGDRNSHTGEHIVWLRPEFAGDRVLMQALLTVWRIPSVETGGFWHLAGPALSVDYNNANAGHVSE